MEKLTTAKRAAVLRCLIEGNSILSTSRITGVAKNTEAVSAYHQRRQLHAGDSDSEIHQRARDQAPQYCWIEREQGAGNPQVGHGSLRQRILLGRIAPKHAWRARRRMIPLNQLDSRRSAMR
jgi:hypothetical protein